MHLKISKHKNKYIRSILVDPEENKMRVVFLSIATIIATTLGQCFAFINNVNPVHNVWIKTIIQR